MSGKKAARRDHRSTITVRLSAQAVDLLMDILSQELDTARKRKQTAKIADISDVLESFQQVIRFEAEQRALRGQTGRVKEEEMDGYRSGKCESQSS